MMNQKQTIDKKYVHKYLDDNVLIAHVRRQLPRVIRKDLFEKQILGRLAPDEGRFLKKYYQWFSGTDDSTGYVLKSAGSAIKTNIKHYIAQHPSDSDDASFVKHVMQSEAFSASDDSLCAFSDACSEFVEDRVLAILGLDSLRIGENERVKIYTLLSRSEFTPWPENFHYAQMHVGIDHAFFFEHPNEHLPGLMLIEAIRQFGLACSHLFLNVPMEGIHFILSDFSVKYRGYLELNRPILFEGQISNASYNKKGMITFADYSTDVFQNGRKMAGACIIAKYLERSLFQILRKANQADMEELRYRPKEEAPLLRYG